MNVKTVFQVYYIMMEVVFIHVHQVIMQIILNAINVLIQTVLIVLLLNVYNVKIVIYLIMEHVSMIVLQECLV